MKRLILLLFLLCVVSNVESYNNIKTNVTTPSLKLFIGDSLFDTIGLFLDPLVGVLVDSLKLPNTYIDKDGNAINVTNIRLRNYHMKGLEFKSNGPPATWVFTLDDANIEIDLDYNLTSAVMNSTGEGIINISATNFVMKLILMPNNGHLFMRIMEFNLDIGDITGKFTGTYGGALDILLEIFKSQIINQTETAIDSLENKINLILAIILGEIPTSIQLYDFAELYFGLTSPNLNPINANANFTDFGLAFEFRPLRGENNDSFPHLSSMPMQPIIGGNSTDIPMIGIAMDQFVANSLSYTLIQSGFLNWSRFPTGKNTSIFKGFLFPELYQKYPNEPMFLNVSIGAYPTFGFDNSNVQVFLPLSLNMSLLNGTSMIDDVMDLKLNVSVSLSLNANVLKDGRNNVSVQISSLSIQLYENPVSKFTFNATNLEKVINIIILSSLPLINKSLKPITLPYLIKDVILLSDKGALQASFSLSLFKKIVTRSVILDMKETFKKAISNMPKYLYSYVYESLHQYINESMYQYI